MRRGLSGKYWPRGIKDRAQRGPYKNGREPHSIFIKTARASKVSRWFIIKHSDQTCIFEFADVLKQKYTAYAVRIAKLRPSKNQSEHSDLPQDYQTK